MAACILLIRLHPMHREKSRFSSHRPAICSRGYRQTLSNNKEETMIFNTTTPAGNGGAPSYEEVTLHSGAYVADGSICYSDEKGIVQTMKYDPDSDMTIKVRKPSVMEVYLVSRSGEIQVEVVITDRSPHYFLREEQMKGHYELATFHI